MKDIQFIAELRKNARKSLTTISRKTQIPISTLFDRLKHHEKSFIIKHTTLLDFNKLGYGCVAMVVLKVDKEHRDAMRKALLAHDSVNSVYRINNGYDYLLEAVFHNVKELEEFLEELESKFLIVEKKTFYIIEHLARELFMNASWKTAKDDANGQGTIQLHTI
ncbi:MAG: Lrp/AsnC ligand binding domain-containing protein [archaeon]